VTLVLPPSVLFEQLASNDELLDLLVKVLEYWRRQQGVITRRSQSTQINITEMDLALCIVTIAQLARHSTVRRQLAQRSVANLLNEVCFFFWPSHCSLWRPHDVHEESDMVSTDAILPCETVYWIKF